MHNKNSCKYSGLSLQSCVSRCTHGTVPPLSRDLSWKQIFQTKQALLVTVVAAEASLAVSAVLDVVFADSGVAAGSSAGCLAAFKVAVQTNGQFFPPLASSDRRHWGAQRMPPPLLFKGYCSQLSIKLKIQDGARRGLGT